MPNTLELPNKAYILPESIPSWPPAWGFWVMLGTAILLILALAVLQTLRYKKRAYRREALQQLSNLSNAPDRELIQACLTVIKRCLITAGHPQLASHTTSELLPMLDTQCKRSRLVFSQFDYLLTEGLYRANSTLTAQEREDLIHLTRHWIKKHHV